MAVHWRQKAKLQLGRRAFFNAQSLGSEISPKQWIPTERSSPGAPATLTGSASQEGLPPIASEPTPSPRLWATPPGATPAGLCEHTMRADRRLSIPELSTLAGIGTFYFGPTFAAQRSTHSLTAAMAWKNSTIRMGLAI